MKSRESGRGKGKVGKWGRLGNGEGWVMFACLCIVVFTTFCVVFFFCLSSSCVPYICCQFLWMVHF